jgi:hypothetical protein
MLWWRNYCRMTGKQRRMVMPSDVIVAWLDWELTLTRESV